MIHIASMTSDDTPLVDAKIDGIKRTIFIDTGCGPNLIDRSKIGQLGLIKSIHEAPKETEDLILTSASGNRLDITGTIKLKLKFKQCATALTFLVVKDLNISDYWFKSYC